MPTYNYVGLGELKTALGIDLDRTEDDELISLAIGAACEVVNNYCGQRFDVVTETRYYNVDNHDYISTPGILSISSLKTDDGTDDVFEDTWTATDYRLWPYGALDSGRTYLRIERTAAGDYTFPVGVRRVEVTGTFGYTEVPDAVRYAALIQATRLYKRKDAPFGVTGSAEMGQLLVIPTLDPDIRLLLAGYRAAPFIV